MIQMSKEPRSPVNKERAMEHALLTIRRAWAGEVRDFDGWGGYELDPEPIVIHDLNGQVLFDEFSIMDENKIVGSTKASASKIIGSAIPTVEFGPRGWILTMPPGRLKIKSKSASQRPRLVIQSWFVIAIQRLVCEYILMIQNWGVKALFLM